MLGLAFGVLDGYTVGRKNMSHVKTAISLEEGLFREVEQVAQELKVPRSRLFVVAMQEYLDRRRDKELLERLNEAYEDYPDPVEREALSQFKRRLAARIEAEEKW